MLDVFTQKKALKIGFLPVRRGAWTHKPFNLPEAVRVKKIIEEKVRQYDAELVTIDFLNDEGIFFNVHEAELVAKRFIDAGVDGIFVPHCNFGSEEAVATLCKLVGKPVLLWGPKDYIDPDDHYRYRDSQCGLFASSKVLGMYGVTFSYIENCDIDDPIFDAGYRQFLSVISVVRSFKSMRIGQISTRPGPFLAVKSNELELLEKFGIQVVPITLADLKRMIDETFTKRADEIEQKVAEMKATFIRKNIEDHDLQMIAAVKLAVESWAINERLSAVSTQCWGPMVDTIGLTPCFLLGEVCDDGLPFICEGDIHGAVSAVLALAATRYATPVFLADITIRHPTNKNAELLWHCGCFAKSLAKDPQSLTINQHYNRLCPAVGEWELKGGDLSIVRFDCAKGQYSLFLGNAIGTEGPATVGAYVWIEVDDWSRWEKKLIFGPYIHHCIGIHANVVPVLQEACRYLPGLLPDLA